jgi:hypothetical protein
MMFVPSLWPDSVDALEVKAPPAPGNLLALVEVYQSTALPCIASDNISQVMKMRVYQTGGIRDMCAP